MKLKYFDPAGASASSARHQLFHQPRLIKQTIIALVTVARQEKPPRDAEKVLKNGYAYP
jgi:hypothetical protein